MQYDLPSVSYRFEVWLLSALLLWTPFLSSADDRYRWLDAVRNRLRRHHRDLSGACDLRAAAGFCLRVVRRKHGPGKKRT